MGHSSSGHVGLTPQRAGLLGGFEVQVKTAHTAQRALQDALAIQEAGACGTVLEVAPDRIVEYITQKTLVSELVWGALDRPCSLMNFIQPKLPKAMRLEVTRVPYYGFSVKQSEYKGFTRLWKESPPSSKCDSEKLNGHQINRCDAKERQRLQELQEEPTTLSRTQLSRVSRLRALLRGFES